MLPFYLKKGMRCCGKSRPKGIDWKGFRVGFGCNLLLIIHSTLSNQYWRGAHHIKKGQRPGELRLCVGWKRSVMDWVHPV